MALAEIRSAWKALLGTVPSVGIVTDFEPWATREEEFKAFFYTPTLGILGWTITRESSDETEETHEQNFSHHMMVIRGYRALSVEGATEKGFQDLIEVIRSVMRHAQLDQLGHLCVNVGPPIVRMIEHRTYGAFLVHYAELTVRCSEHMTL